MLWLLPATLALISLNPTLLSCSRLLLHFHPNQRHFNLPPTYPFQSSLWPKFLSPLVSQPLWMRPPRCQVSLILVIDCTITYRSSQWKRKGIVVPALMVSTTRTLSTTLSPTLFFSIPSPMPQMMVFGTPSRKGRLLVYSTTCKCLIFWIIPYSQTFF